MNDQPSINCAVCGEPAFDSAGKPIGTVWIYQRLEGELCLAVTLIMDVPIVCIHKKCRHD